MTIEPNKVVSIEYTLKDKNGEIIDTSVGAEPLDYIHGRRDLISGLESLLTGKKAGDEFHAEIEPADAYGEVKEDLLIEVPKSHFPEDVALEVGMQFQADATDGATIVAIKEIKADTVIIDANHPLAGEKLFFDVRVVAVRDATSEELANGLNPSGGCGGCGGSCGGGCGCGGDCGDGCGCGE